MAVEANQERGYVMLDRGFCEQWSVSRLSKVRVESERGAEVFAYSGGAVQQTQGWLMAGGAHSHQCSAEG